MTQFAPGMRIIVRDAEQQEIVDNRISLVRNMERLVNNVLNIFYGNMEGIIYNTSVYFKNIYDREWLEEEQVKAMIADVDKSEVLSVGAISSPVMGIIPPTSLSGGVKTLILIDKISDKVFNASNCGDNCAHWLLKIAEDKDVTINLRHLMNFGKGTFNIRILNTDTVVHSMRELVPIAGRFV